MKLLLAAAALGVLVLLYLVITRVGDFMRKRVPGYIAPQVSVTGITPIHCHGRALLPLQLQSRPPSHTVNMDDPDWARTLEDELS